MLNRLKYPAALFLILSMIVHFSAFVSLDLFAPRTLVLPSENVEIEFVEPTPSPQLREQKQIVQQEQRLNDEKSDDAKYLSQFDQVVKKQTRAEKTGEFRNTATPGERVAGSEQAPKEPKPTAPPKKGPGSKVKSLSDLVPKYSLTPDGRKDLAQHTGDPSQTDDYLKDVEMGLQTALTTREFLYYSYYNRIKAKIRQYWEPNVREQVKIIYRTGRSIASSSDRVTQVLITLDAKGELKRIEVITQSGLQPIDEAAVKAFKQAAPFPNPPKGMVEADGFIRIRWDFILEARSLLHDSENQYAQAPLEWRLNN
jgi:TonB family protein